MKALAAGNGAARVGLGAGQPFFLGIIMPFAALWLPAASAERSEADGRIGAGRLAKG